MLRRRGPVLSVWPHVITKVFGREGGGRRAKGAAGPGLGAQARGGLEGEGAALRAARGGKGLEPGREGPLQVGSALPCSSLLTLRFQRPDL